MKVALRPKFYAFCIFQPGRRQAKNFGRYTGSSLPKDGLDCALVWRCVLNDRQACRKPLAVTSRCNALGLEWTSPCNQHFCLNLATGTALRQAQGKTPASFSRLGAYDS